MSKVERVKAEGAGTLTQSSVLGTHHSSLSTQHFRRLLTSETSRQTSLLFTAQLMSTVLNAATGAVVARWLGKENFGLFVFCSISIVQFLSYFFEFGIAAAGARLLAIERGTQGERRIFGALLLLAIIVGMGFSASVALSAGLIDPIFKTQVREILLVVAPLCAVVPLQFFLEQACQGLNRIAALALLRVMLPGTSFVLIATTLGLHRLTILTALLASLTGIALACLFIIVLLRPSLVSLRQNIGQILTETRRFGLDMYFGRITTMASTKLDSVLIPAFLNATTFGFYTIAQKFAEPLTNLSRSMAITRFKTFANEPAVRRAIVQFNLLFLAAGAMVLILLGPYALVLIYSEEYMPAARLMLPFAIGSFFGGLFQPYNSFLSAHGRGGELRNISFAIGAINVTSLLFVIPRFGVMGAAWMVAAAAALNFSLHYYYYSTFYREQASKRALRIAMVDLSNDTRAGIAWLRERYGEAEFELLNKTEIKSGSKFEWLRRLRAREYNIFVILCDRLEWQTRRIPMLIFGLLSGAQECWLVDCHGRAIGRSRWMILLAEIPHLGIEVLGSFFVVAASWLLTRLLQLVVKYRPLNWSGKPEGTLPRIVFIRTTPTSGAQTGGSNSHITGFTNGAVAEGATLSFISNDAISGIKKEQTPIEVIEPSSFFNANRMIFELWNNLTFTVRALGRVRSAQPDLLYQRYSRFSWAGVAISHLTRTPLILEYNGSEVWIGRHWDSVSLLWLLVRFERLNLLGAQLIFVVSEVEKENLIRAGVPASKIRVNPNGVDPEVFKPDQGGAEVRSKLGIENETVVGFVGTFGPWHGVLVLAKAITQVPREANCHFLLIGEGSLKSDVEKIVGANGCADRVTFTGRLNHRQVPAYLDACDILVSPHVPMEDGSDFFGSPTKLFEYMAMARPIVASRLGQIADVIDDGRNGCLIEPGNVEALTEAIMRLAADPAERARLGKQARQDAIANYTWRRNAARVIEAYRALNKDRH